MIISELINKLQEFKKEYGDLEVYISDSEYGMEPAQGMIMLEETTKWIGLNRFENYKVACVN